MNDIRYDLTSNGETVAVGILPTPMLLSEGSVGTVDAYRTDDVDGYPGGLWRVRDDAYDPAGTEYTRVHVVRLESRECHTCGAWYFGSIIDHAETDDHKAYVADVRGW